MKWKEEEIDFLVKNLDVLSRKSIATHLGRSKDSVNKKVAQLGLAEKAMPTKVWTDEELDYVDKNYGILTAKQISIELNRSVDSVKGAFRKIEDKSRKFIANKWTDEELNFLKENFDKMNYHELSKALNRTLNSVTLKANRIGLKLKKETHYEKDFFKEIDTEEKAYWLGFIYADGYVSVSEKDRRYEFGIELSMKDSSHLEKLNKSINGNAKITSRSRTIDFKKYKSHTKMSSIRFYCKDITYDLISHGVVPNKTKILEFPKNLKKDLLRHFVRGFIDGDGYISFNERKYGYKTRIGFVCESEKFAKSMIEECKEYLSLGSMKITHEKNRSISNFDTSNQAQVYEFANFLYKDATIYLDRKYNVYLQMIKYLESKNKPSLDRNTRS